MVKEETQAALLVKEAMAFVTGMRLDLEHNFDSYCFDKAKAIARQKVGHTVNALAVMQLKFETQPTELVAPAICMAEQRYWKKVLKEIYKLKE